MSASFLATIFIFSITGIIALFRLLSGESISGIAAIDVPIAAIIFSNAVFFLYVELYTETDEAEISRLRVTSRWQWIIRVINYSNITLMWVWLNLGLVYCIASLFFMYVLILLWDSIVLRSKSYIGASTNNGDIGIVVHDLIGFLSTFGVMGSIFYFKTEYQNLGINGGSVPINGEILHQLTTLSVILSAFFIIYIINAWFVIKKINVDFRLLMSSDRRT